MKEDTTTPTYGRASFSPSLFYPPPLDALLLCELIFSSPSLWFSYSQCVFLLLFSLISPWSPLFIEMKMGDPARACMGRIGTAWGIESSWASCPYHKRDLCLNKHNQSILALKWCRIVSSIMLNGTDSSIFDISPFTVGWECTVRLLTWGVSLGVLRGLVILEFNRHSCTRVLSYPDVNSPILIRVNLYLYEFHLVKEHVDPFP